MAGVRKKENHIFVPVVVLVFTSEKNGISPL